MKTGRRAWKCELSTIDTTYLLGGLTAARYFDRDNKAEREIRTLAESLLQTSGLELGTERWSDSLAWLETGDGIHQVSLDRLQRSVDLVCAGSCVADFPLPPESYRAWTRILEWKLYGHEFLYAGPLFIHHLSHMWIDFRGIQDDYMRGKAINYFENSRRAIYAQQAYAMRNPKKFVGYDRFSWGITATDGPGPAERRINGRRCVFRLQSAILLYGPDDGTPRLGCGRRCRLLRK